MKIDAIDRRILAELQANGRITNNDLAERIGLSPSPCLRRVRALEAAGLIAGYAALLDPAQLDLGTSVFVRVWLVGQDDETVRRFTDAILVLPHVVECQMMAGDCDFLLRVVALGASQSLEDPRRRSEIAAGWLCISGHASSKLPAHPPCIASLAA